MHFSKNRASELLYFALPAARARAGDGLGGDRRKEFSASHFESLVSPPHPPPTFKVAPRSLIINGGD